MKLKSPPNSFSHKIHIYLSSVLTVTKLKLYTLEDIGKEMRQFLVSLLISAYLNVLLMQSLLII